jgi:hypothetical protein
MKNFLLDPSLSSEFCDTLFCSTVEKYLVVSMNFHEMNRMVSSKKDIHLISFRQRCIESDSKYSKYLNRKYWNGKNLFQFDWGVLNLYSILGQGTKFYKILPKKFRKFVEKTNRILPNISDEKRFREMLQNSHWPLLIALSKCENQIARLFNMLRSHENNIRRTIIWFWQLNEVIFLAERMNFTQWHNVLFLFIWWATSSAKYMSQLMKMLLHFGSNFLKDWSL